MDPAGGKTGVRARAGERKRRRRSKASERRQVGLLPAPESTQPQVGPP